MFYLLLTCLLITLTYNTVIFITYKTVPVSLSETSYMMGGNWRYFFTGYCFLLCLLILPVLLELTPENFQIIPFVFCGGLSFAGCTPFFKEESQRKTHYIAAIIAFAGFVLYMALCMHWLWIGCFVVILGALCLWKYKCYIYFGEMLAILTILCYSFLRTFNVL